MNESTKLIAASYIANVIEVNKSEKIKTFDPSDVTILESAKDVLLGQQKTTMKEVEPEVSFEQLVKDGYELLKDESKPATGLLVKELDIDLPTAKKVLTQVKKKIKKSKEQKPSATTPSDLLKTIADGGESLLVKKPYSYLIHLDEKQRATYLAGLKIDDCVDMEELERAVIEGADKTLVDQIIKLSKKKRPDVPAKSIVDAKKYEKHILAWTNKIHNGGELFNLLAEKGLSKAVLSHFKTIASAQ